MYTDGACKGNPGAGGFCCILKYKGKEKLVSGGEANTTNNRMELRAVISGLEILREPCEVTVYSDSKYVVDAMKLGWARGWKEKKAGKKERRQVGTQYRPLGAAAFSFRDAQTEVCLGKGTRRTRIQRAVRQGSCRAGGKIHIIHITKHERGCVKLGKKICLRRQCGYDETRPEGYRSDEALSYGMLGKSLEHIRFRSECQRGSERGEGKDCFSDGLRRRRNILYFMRHGIR